MTTLLHKNVQNITLLLLHFFLLFVSFFGIPTLGLYRVSSWLMISSSFINYFILGPRVTSRLIMFQPFSMIFHVIPTSCRSFYHVTWSSDSYKSLALHPPQLNFLPPEENLQSLLMVQEFPQNTS